MDIFSRLSGKSIARCRCVSELWGYILRSHGFTELFLTKSSTRPRLFFTLEADGKLFFYSSPQPQTQTQDPDDNSTLVATRYHTSFPKKFPSHHRTPVCGLALLHGGRKTKVRVICNPITGEFLTLPEVLPKKKTLPQVKAKSNIPDTEARETIASFYLGYDPISKQFKVLCMTSSRGEMSNTHQVLTLKSESRLWRRIGCKFPFTETYRMFGEVCINGVLYFGAKMGQSRVVVCFDVRPEKFGFINLDKDMLGEDNSYGGCLALFNYKGKLGIRQETNQDRELVLWVLEDAGSHKWSKQTCVLPRLSSRKRFVGMTATGDIVLTSLSNERSDLFCVYLYNLESKTFTSVNIQGFEEFTHRNIRTFLDYVENRKFLY